MAETTILGTNVESFDWGIAIGSTSCGDPIHHVVFDGRMLCSGGKARVTYYGTLTAMRPCPRCRRIWRAQTEGGCSR